MSLRRSLLALALLPIALPAMLVARRLGLSSYTIDPAKLPRRSFTHARVDFVRCPDCGRDGVLMISGQVMARVVTHERAVRMLADWAHTLSGTQYAHLYNQVAAANWLPGYMPMLPLPQQDPTYAQVNLAVRVNLMVRETLHNRGRRRARQTAYV